MIEILIKIRDFTSFKQLIKKPILFNSTYTDIEHVDFDVMNKKYPNFISFLYPHPLVYYKKIESISQALENMHLALAPLIEIQPEIVEIKNYLVITQNRDMLSPSRIKKKKYVFGRMSKMFFNSSYHDQIGGLVGKGNYPSGATAIVKKIFSKDNCTEYYDLSTPKYAMKRYKPEDHWERKIPPEKLEFFAKNEAAVARLLGRNGVYGARKKDTGAQQFYLVTDYLSGRELFEEVLAEDSRVPNLSLIQIVHLLICLANEIHLLHKHGLVNLDLRSENVFIDPSRNQLTLCDLGSIKEEKKEAKYNFSCIRTCMAPEIISGAEKKQQHYCAYAQQHFDKRAEIYSFSIIAALLLPSYFGITLETSPVSNYIKYVVNTIQVKEKSSQYTKLIELINRGLSAAPDSRPTIGLILSELRILKDELLHGIRTSQSLTEIPSPSKAIAKFEAWIAD